MEVEIIYKPELIRLEVKEINAALVIIINSMLSCPGIEISFADYVKISDRVSRIVELLGC
jgi:hypothetical protein